MVLLDCRTSCGSIWSHDCWAIEWICSCRRSHLISGMIRLEMFSNPFCSSSRTSEMERLHSWMMSWRSSIRFFLVRVSWKEQMVTGHDCPNTSNWISCKCSQWDEWISILCVSPNSHRYGMISCNINQNQQNIQQGTEYLSSWPNQELYGWQMHHWFCLRPRCGLHHQQCVDLLFLHWWQHSLSFLFRKSKVPLNKSKLGLGYSSEDSITTNSRISVL